MRQAIRGILVTISLYFLFVQLVQGQTIMGTPQYVPGKLYLKLQPGFSIDDPAIRNLLNSVGSIIEEQAFPSSVAPGSDSV